MNKEEIKLNMLCDIYGSDKGSMIDDIKYETYNGYAHNYTKIYSLLFSPLKMEKINILEVGLGTNNTSIPSNMGELGKPGASLRVWKDYFNNASIYGADVDKDILFQEDRITTGYMDQLDKNSIEEFFKNLNNFTPNVVIDDGLHTLDAAITLHKNCINRVASGGFYIIEDVIDENLDSLKEHLNQYNDKYEVHVLEQDHVKRIDNIIFVITKS